MGNCFVAIDFETANVYKDSACAVGIVRVENNELDPKTGEAFKVEMFSGIIYKT